MPNHSPCSRALNANHLLSARRNSAEPGRPFAPYPRLDEHIIVNALVDDWITALESTSRQYQARG